MEYAVSVCPHSSSTNICNVETAKVDVSLAKGHSIRIVSAVLCLSMGCFTANACNIIGNNSSTLNYNAKTVKGPVARAPMDYLQIVQVATKNSA